MRQEMRLQKQELCNGLQQRPLKRTSETEILSYSIPRGDEWTTLLNSASFPGLMSESVRLWLRMNPNRLNEQKDPHFKVGALRPRAWRSSWYGLLDSFFD